MSELPDIYVSKHALTHMDDTGMLSIASFSNGDMRECYTPKSKLKEADSAIKDLILYSDIVTQILKESGFPGKAEALQKRCFRVANLIGLQRSINNE